MSPGIGQRPHSRGFAHVECLGGVLPQPSHSPTLKIQLSGPIFRFFPHSTDLRSDSICPLTIKIVSVHVGELELNSVTS